MQFHFPFISWSEQVALESSIEGDRIGLLRVLNWAWECLPLPHDLYVGTGGFSGDR